MKKFLVLIGLALVVSITPLRAQSLQLQARTAANPNPGQTVTKYRGYVDALPPVDLPATLDPTCSCVVFDFSVSTTGPHTVKISAANIDPLGNPQESAPLVANFTVFSLVVVPPPGTPAGPITIIVK